MKYTLQDVQGFLLSEEPVYEEINKMLDNNALPLLDHIVKGDDVMMATKATYMASLLPSREAYAIVYYAAQHKDELLKLAAASSLPNLPPLYRVKIAGILLQEKDPAIQKLVLKAFLDKPTKSLKIKGQVQDIVKQTSDEIIWALSDKILNPTKKKDKPE